MKCWKRLGAGLLTLTMLLSLMPGAAFAKDAPVPATAEKQADTYRIHVDTKEGEAFARVLDENGNLTGVSEAAPGETIYMEFYDVNMTPGTAFQKWVDDKGNLTDLRNPSSYYECSFTMPAEDVSIHAQLADNCPTITVENGAMMVPEGDHFNVLKHSSVYPNRIIYLYYDDEQTPAGKVFVEWDVKYGAVELSDSTSMNNCNFIVPNHDAKIGVDYQDAFGISVQNGYAQFELPNGEYIWDTRTAAPGTQMYLMLNPYTKPEGMAFSKWVVKKGTVTLDRPESSYECPFIMPSEDVEIVAEFVPGHALTVEGGVTRKTMSDGKLDWYIDTAAAGDLVWADCSNEEAPQGMEFARWVVTQGSMKLDRPEDEVCSFIMPEEEVVVTATYKPVGGKAEAGWHDDKAGRWYNDETGHYVTGWQNIDGKRYYFHENGYMAKDEWIDGHYVDGSGALVEKPVQTGWQHNDYGWWYNDESGNYVTGWQVINGYWYYFASNGYMQTGWQVINGYWYYFAPGGDMQTGWQVINGYWYYFSPSGDMQTGWQVINGYWYYFSPSGDMQTGWQVINGYWYYFAPGGDMQTGWQMINGYWYYFSPSGDMQTGWQWIDGKCYYFYPSGYMATNTWINGSYVNGSGVWVS